LTPPLSLALLENSPLSLALLDSSPKGGAKCTHCSMATYYLTCLSLWDGEAMP
jgi:hypothetical protein